MRGQQKRELFTWESIELMVAIGWGLGLVFGAGVAVVFMAPSWLNFALLGISMSVFHMWEWLFVALKRPHDLSGHSFLLDHSTEYTIAWGFCITEYLVERYFFPGLKQHTYITVPLS
ncbi:hypothetical protein Pelo_19170 [Pelomyxa schiedti]|nr:hypothetical protein Pelo_19170 [Pelomyxa schiedti]